MNTNHIESILQRALACEHLTLKDGMALLGEGTTGQLMAAANTLRMLLHPDKEVTWIIDRNVNISNVCHAGCLFCNFSCSRNSQKAFITTHEQYREKIGSLFQLGGNQLLLQGGLHPDLGIGFYVDLFSRLKQEYPTLKLHALGPPEVVHLARLDGLSYGEVLDQLTAAGLDSLPGAGAEILSDRVRAKLSPGKCTSGEWLEVMHEAHVRGIVTSATMMFGHIETLEERVEHLILLRDLQHRRPEGSTGFVSFIPWPYQDAGTALAKRHQVHNTVTSLEYVRFFAVARLVLNNIPNMQPSWLTVGVPTAQICLHGGGNDFGSVMVEEHVVSSAGATHTMDAEGMMKAIRDAGFTPVFRDQRFVPQEYRPGK
jgi:cyclic dehypoxanthinyl futalosine synthase